MTTFGFDASSAHETPDGGSTGSTPRTTTHPAWGLIVGDQLVETGDVVTSIEFNGEFMMVGVGAAGLLMIGMNELVEVVLV